MADLCSSGGGGPVVLRFKNERSFDVRLYWLDYEGRAQQYGVVAPDTSIDQGTYATHAWRACDERSGVALVEYVGPSATIVLQADGSLRVEAAGPNVPPLPEAVEAEAAEEAPAEETAEGAEGGEEALADSEKVE